jgi:hypothetical protein
MSSATEATGEQDESTESNPEDTTHVERSDVGASMSVDITRGTGTRDQEKYSIKGKGKNAEEAIKEFETQLEAIEQKFAQRIRNLQVEVETEAEGES